MPDAASGCLNISRPSGYQVDMAMEDRLARIFAAVHTDVKPSHGLVPPLYLHLLFVQQPIDSIDLRLCKVEVISGMSLGDE